MNEKTLEKVTGLSRRQIIMLQKTVITRKNKIVVGLSYDYSDDEVEEFMLAKFFKDCGYTYPEIKKEMDRYRKNKIEVLDEIISKMESKVEELKQIIKKAKELKEED
jgi:DNA-binding transcriptional MerR regulator